MKRITFIILAVLSCLSLQAGQPVSYQTGDFIFQDLDCGELCDAIEEVTQGYDSYHFSHIGMVYIKDQDTMVIEAIGKGVQLTSIDSFLSRTRTNVHGRLKKKYRHLIPEAIGFSLKNTGTAYDDEFLYNNGKYYCSELLYDAFKYANNNKAFFELQPMTFKKPGTNDFYPVWIAYYEKLGIDIPEGQPGCNPGEFSRSDKLEIIR